MRPDDSNPGPDGYTCVHPHTDCDYRSYAHACPYTHAYGDSGANTNAHARVAVPDRGDTPVHSRPSLLS